MTLLVLLTFLTQKAYIWDETGLPENYTIEDIPADMVDDAAMNTVSNVIETALEARRRSY